MVSGVMDISTIPGCGWAIDPDMALSSSPGPDDTMVPGDSVGHSDWHDPGGGMAFRNQHSTGCSLDLGHPCDLWSYHGPWTSTKTLAMVRHDPYQQPGVRCRGPTWQLQATQFGMALVTV